MVVVVVNHGESCGCWREMKIAHCFAVADSAATKLYKVILISSSRVPPAHQSCAY